MKLETKHLMHIHISDTFLRLEVLYSTKKSDNTKKKQKINN